MRVRSAALLVLLLFTPLRCRSEHDNRSEIPALGDYRVQWSLTRVPSTMEPGWPRRIEITATNRGTSAWRSAKLRGDPARTVRASYRWLRRQDQTPFTDWIGRIELPHDVAPGQSVILKVDVMPPLYTGDYTLQIDLVQELVAWFSDAGAAKALVSVRVE